jgi:hypothetical protein
MVDPGLSHRREVGADELAGLATDGPCLAWRAAAFAFPQGYSPFSEANGSLYVR